MPSSWTTLYTLSQLADVDIAKYHKDGRLTREMQGTDALTLIELSKGPLPSSKQNQNKAESVQEFPPPDKGYCVSISFYVTPTKAEIVELTDFLNSYKEKTNCSVALTDVLEQLFADFSSTSEREV